MGELGSQVDVEDGGRVGVEGVGVEGVGVEGVGVEGVGVGSTGEDTTIAPLISLTS